MKRIATFELVSENQFLKDWLDCFPNTTIEETIQIYRNIQLPKRATSGSAGYDFFAPIHFEIAPNQTIKIPTGIRVKMDEGWVLKCYPRSSLGFKYRLQLNNTVGIIDSDYYYSDNEGHIFVKLTNASTENKTIKIEPQDGFMQGIFVEYGITHCDNVTTIRNGGLGSTTGTKFSFPKDKILKVFLVDKDFLKPENFLKTNHTPFHTFCDSVTDNIIYLCYDAIFTCIPVDEQYLRKNFYELVENNIKLDFQYNIEFQQIIIK